MVDAIGSDDPRIQSGRFTFQFMIGREHPWGANSETGLYGRLLCFLRQSSSYFEAIYDAMRAGNERVDVSLKPLEVQQKKPVILFGQIQRKKQ